MAQPPLCSLQDVSLAHDRTPLFTDVTLHLYAGERYCLIGRNGAGKSTLLSLITGAREPDVGERFLQPGVRIGYLPQELPVIAKGTVREFVTDGLDEESHYLADIALDGVKLDPEADMATLSGGGLRRAALARALLDAPDILLLDEPTNHMDVEAIEWLENYLNGYRGAVIVISHDRRFLEAMTTQMLWLDRGALRQREEGFKAFEDWMDEITEAESKELDRMQKHLEQETDWLHKGVTARRKRNVRRLKELHALRAQLKDQQAHAYRSEASVAIKGGKEQKRSGNRVIELEHLSKTIAGRELIRDFSTAVIRGRRIGVVGPNGVGKTTLIRMIIGDLEPDAGTVKLGAELDVSFFDQKREALEPEKTLWRTLCPDGGDQVIVGGRHRHVVAYLKDFLFTPDEIKGPVSALSGGQANRLLLAKVLANPGNLLILDEPTNDLDMDTLEVLLEVLDAYTGTLIIVSHDRDFLDRLVHLCWVFDGKGGVHEEIGGYSDYRKYHAPEGKLAPAAEKKAVARPKQATKLSYKDQRALEMLPGQMAALQGEIDALEAELADPELFHRDGARFNAASARLDAAKQELDAAEEQWLELEMKRETMQEAG